MQKRLKLHRNRYLNIFLVYKHLLWVRLTVPTRKVIACAAENLLTQLFSTVLEVLSSLYSITLLAINPKIGAGLTGTHFSWLTMLGWVISSNELCFLTAKSQERDPDSLIAHVQEGRGFVHKNKFLKIKRWCGETCLSSQQCQPGSCQGAT